MVILLFNPEWVLLGLIWEEANGQLGMQSKFKCWSNLSEFWVAQEFLQSPPSSYLVKVFSWYQMPTAFTLLLSWPRGPPPGVPYFSLSDLSPIQNIPSASLTWSLCSCFGVAQLRGHCSHWSPWEWCWSVHPGGGVPGPLGPRGCFPLLLARSLRPFPWNWSHRRGFRFPGWLWRKYFLNRASLLRSSRILQFGSIWA